ncbi:FAD-dependent monooxygenase [Streptomyces sp.]|uniref:FAD-dependent monooxygenase n=1 Tax=Streptomyces sp. TaxID=1931 RepID=UPI002F3FAF8B
MQSEAAGGAGGAALDADVIIVGAGPAGLMLAGELRLGGAKVIVLERLLQPTGQSRGLGFTARAMEVFDQRGLLPAFGGPNGTLEISPLGHFGGIQFDFTVLEGSHFGARGILQSLTESVLEQWAVGLGADLRRGWEFLEFGEGEGGVTVTAGTADGVRHLRASYLVGCDGGHSAVRKAAGFEFPGTNATRGMYLADVVGCGLRPRFLGERLPGGMIMAAPLREGVDRVIVVENGTPAPDRSESPSFAEIAGAWERITGEDISGGSADWVSWFSDATRQVTEYRRGRVLLAGDAAHVHLPAGGQGLSTGVQDAANLGWKLAAVVTGWAPQELLDTYHGERHPVGKRLLMNTAAQGMIFVGGPEMDPIRAMFTELIDHEEVRRHLSGIVSHVDIRYPYGGPDAHPLVGRRMPHLDLTVAGGTSSTTELLHPAQGVLLDLVGDPALRGVAAPWKSRVVPVAAALADSDSPAAAELTGATAVLIRPDGHVVWASAEGDGLAAALERWFGAPETSA